MQNLAFKVLSEKDGCTVIKVTDRENARIEYNIPVATVHVEEFLSGRIRGEWIRENVWDEPVLYGNLK